MFYLLNAAGGLLSSLLSLAVYLLGAYALYKVARLRFLPNAWLAFIPIFNLYMIGMILDSMKYNHYKINHYLSDVPLSYVLPIAALVSNLLPVIPLIGDLAVLLISLGLWLAELLMYYFIFDLYAEPKNTNLFTLLSVIPLLGPILTLYVLKDRRY